VVFGRGRFAKLFPDGVFFSEIFLNECLIHDYGGPRRTWVTPLFAADTLKSVALKSRPAKNGMSWSQRNSVQLQAACHGCLILRHSRPVKAGNPQPVAQQRQD